MTGSGLESVSLDSKYFYFFGGGLVFGEYSLSFGILMAWTIIDGCFFVVVPPVFFLSVWNPWDLKRYTLVMMTSKSEIVFLWAQSFGIKISAYVKGRLLKFSFNIWNKNYS